MILPTKYLDLPTCVLGVSAEVLVALRQNRLMQYDELLGQVQAKLPSGARFNFPMSLDLLYLLGQIEYHEETDSIGLVEAAQKATTQEVTL